MGVPVKRRIADAAADNVDVLELDLLLEAIYRLYGYDFRGYARTSMRRRIANAMKQEAVSTISALQERVLHDRAAFERLLAGISVNVSAMFRDPGFFLAFRKQAVPLLRTYPFIRIWQAGCSLGEEAYSLAILLEEEGLYDRSLIYATDINETSLRRAREAIYPADLMQKYTQNYLQSGGRQSFSEYYTARYDFAILRPSLQRNIVFSQHNLVSDGTFNEFNVILCRNVMIYFSRPLQEKTHALFHASLGMFGILGLGSRESLRFMPQESLYEPLVPDEKLYRRIA
jgi:chemotaxis protein methyltransferase CheR